MMLRCANRSSAVAVLGILASLAWGGQVSATSLTVGTPTEQLSVSYNGQSLGNVLAGNWTGTLGGQNLSYLYCVDATGEIGVPGTYNTTVTNNGTVFGSSVPNVSVVAALLDKYAAADTGASMAVQSAALQAAIWTAEYGNGLSFSLVGQSQAAQNAFQSAYSTYVAYANTNPAGNIGNYQWLSPYDSNGNSTQGLVTSGGVGASPEPSSVVLMGVLASALGLFHYRPRRTRAVL